MDVFFPVHMLELDTQRGKIRVGLSEVLKSWGKGLDSRDPPHPLSYFRTVLASPQRGDKQGAVYQAESKPLADTRSSHAFTLGFSSPRNISDMCLFINYPH